MRVSIIIPALDEAAGIATMLATLMPLREQGCEVIVVDGGSADETPDLARAASDQVLVAPRGRASQMNAGAAVAGGDVLMFLHADTRLPDGALAAIHSALEGGRFRWGRFDVVLDGHHPMLKVIAFMMNRRSCLTGVATGDQALFMTRAVFDAVGGFPPLPLMEDVAISKTLRRLAKPACLRLKVTTSARRWETRGVWRTMLLMWRLRLAYFLGVSAESLHKRYR